MPTRTTAAGKRPRGRPDEINELYDRILRADFEQGSRSKALRYVDRLHELLTEHHADHEAIFGEECWSLVYELKGDLAGAIRHREKEIELIQRLWEVSANTPGMAAALRAYRMDDLADRLDLLAILYHDSGDLDRAILTLLRSKWLCESFKIPFEGEEVLQDYLYEKNQGMGLIRALEKQGWTFSGHGHGATSANSGSHSRSRRARLRRGGPPR